MIGGRVEMPMSAMTISWRLTAVNGRRHQIAKLRRSEVTDGAGYDEKSPIGTRIGGQPRSPPGSIAATGMPDAFTSCRAGRRRGRLGSGIRSGAERSRRRSAYGRNHLGSAAPA